MAKNQPEFRAPQGVHVQTPSGDSLFGAETAAKSTWLDLPERPTPGRYGELPYNAAPVLLTPDGERQIVAQWRTSRELDRNALRWVMVGFWTERNSGGRRIEFEPLGWREYVE